MSVTRLTLRPISVADVAFLEALHRDPEHAFFAVDRTPSRDAHHALVDV